MRRTLKLVLLPGVALLVTVDEYDVTDLGIEVHGPDDSLMFEVDWAPDHDTTSHLR